MHTRLAGILKAADQETTMPQVFHLSDLSSVLCQFLAIDLPILFLLPNLDQKGYSQNVASLYLVISNLYISHKHHPCIS